MIQRLTVMGGSSNAKIHNLDRGKTTLVRSTFTSRPYEIKAMKQEEERGPESDRLNDGDDGLKGNL